MDGCVVIIIIIIMIGFIVPSTIYMFRDTLHHYYPSPSEPHILNNASFSYCFSCSIERI